MRLVGTTKSTIASIRDRTHWNSANLAPMDPVTLGLASQIDLDLEVQRANKEKPAPVDTGATLLPGRRDHRAQGGRSRRRSRRSPRKSRAARLDVERRLRQAQAARRQRRQGRRVGALRNFRR